VHRPALVLDRADLLAAVARASPVAPAVLHDHLDALLAEVRAERVVQLGRERPGDYAVGDGAQRRFGLSPAWHLLPPGPGW
jgi:hypothetical protein